MRSALGDASAWKLHKQMMVRVVLAVLPLLLAVAEGFGVGGAARKLAAPAARGRSSPTMQEEAVMYGVEVLLAKGRIYPAWVALVSMDC